MWIIDAPVLSKDNVNEYTQFIDAIVKACVPDVNENPEFFHLFKTYHVHSHSKSYRKCKNEKCCYHFGKFFTDHTIVSFLLPDDLPEQVKNNICNEREHVFSKVRQYIDTNLDLRKQNVMKPLKADFEELLSIRNIFAGLGITEKEYYSALTISIDTDFQIHIKREPNACFVNNYFVEGLQAWKANIDIQPVLNHYKAIA